MIWGTFYFNMTPMVPPECKIIFHDKPGKRGSWEFHGVPEFYIGYFMNIYRTYNVYIPKKKVEQSEDTVKMFHIQLKYHSF